MSWSEAARLPGARACVTSSVRRKSFENVAHDERRIDARLADGHEALDGNRQRRADRTGERSAGGATSDDDAFSEKLKLFLNPQPNERVTPTDAPYERLLNSVGMLSRTSGVAGESKVAS